MKLWSHEYQPEIAMSAYSYKVTSFPDNCAVALFMYVMCVFHGHPIIKNTSEYN